MGVGLTATGRLRAGKAAISCRVSVRPGSADVCAHTVAMARHLCFRQCGLTDSAGNIRPQPSTPRLPGLRRGSHNAQHSTAADCWQPRIWHLTGYAYGAGCRLFVRSRDRNQRPMSLMPEPKNFQSLFQIQRRQTYEYGWRAAPPTAWSRRQCRKDFLTRRNAA